MEEVCDDIIKSPFDVRSYRYFKLKNKMQVLVIHDPTSLQGAASMNVNVGYWSDPENLPGLAHFCEHMLFMGTTKYPDENHYSSFLSEHGGSSNAYTSEEDTNYYFDISAKYFDQALDVFSRFFIDPLMLEDSTDRELKAVDSEYKNALASDGWRYMYLRKSATHPAHPTSKFGTGNVTTLDTPNTRTALIDFHDKYYHASRMSLCVFTNESIDSISKVIIEKFGEVKNEMAENTRLIEFHDKEGNRIVPQAYGEDRLKKYYQFVPKQDERCLRLLWPMPPQHPYYLKKAFRYLGNLIGHESKGSIFYLLQKNSWATELIAGEMTSSTDYDTFGVNINLTPAGQQNIPQIISIIYSYIRVLEQSDFPEWLHLEGKNIFDVEFLFADPGSPVKQVTNLATQMSLSNRVDVKHLLNSAYISGDYDKEHIKALTKLITPSNMLIFESSLSFAGKTTNTEKWFGTDYLVNNISEDDIKAWENAPLLPELHLPKPNPFIPTNFDVVGKKSEIPARPKLIRNDEQVQLWFKQDDQFLKPKANMVLSILTTKLAESPISILYSQLFEKLVGEQMNDITYNAQVAGMSFSIDIPNDGIVIFLCGYTSSFIRFASIVFEYLTKFTFDPTNNEQLVAFECQKEKLYRKYKNYSTQQSYEIAQLASQGCLSSRFSIAERLAIFDQITPVAFSEFLKTVFVECRVKALAHGNLVVEDAYTIIDNLLNFLKDSKPIPLEKIPENLVVRLPEKQYVVYNEEQIDAKAINSSIYYYFQIGLDQHPTSILSKLLSHIIAEPAFDELRTKQQLGYIVFSNVRVSYTSIGLSFTIQSPTHDPNILQQRIWEFLQLFVKQLEDMSEDNFKAKVTGLITIKEEKDRKMELETFKYWTELTNRSFVFNRVKNEIEQLRQVTKQQLINFIKERKKSLIEKYTAVFPNGKMPSEDSSVYPHPATILNTVDERIAWKAKQSYFTPPTYNPPVEFCVPPASL